MHRNNWSSLPSDAEAPLDPNLVPASKSGTPITRYMTTRPFKMTKYSAEGIFFQLRKDFSDFLREGVMRVCAEPAALGPHNTVSELVLYSAFVDIMGNGPRVLLYFDFCRSRIRVDGFAFKVLNFRIPKKWALFGSHDCENWSPIYRHAGLLKPGVNTFVQCRHDISPPYRYLMLKIYRRNLLMEKLDFFGMLEPE
jgi:hypothetical protein